MKSHGLALDLPFSRRGVFKRVGKDPENQSFCVCFCQHWLGRDAGWKRGEILRTRALCWEEAVLWKSLVFQLRRYSISSSTPFPQQQNPLSPPSSPTLVNRPVVSHMISNFVPLGLHLLSAQMYLSSEKGSYRLASGRIVSPALWFCLTGPGTATRRTLEASGRACPLGWRTCLLFTLGFQISCWVWLQDI